MSKLTEAILKKIKKEGIAPKSRFYFIVIRVLIWASLIFTVILGGMAFSVTLSHILGTDWAFVGRFDKGSSKPFIFMLPYLWFLFICFTLYGSHVLFKNTKTGYRIKPAYVIATSVFLSFVLGLILYFVHFDRPFEKRIERHFPPYAGLQDFGHRMFVDPEKGFLGGRINEFKPKERMKITDFKNTEWMVNINNAVLPFSCMPEFGMRVGIIGKKTGDKTFQAIEVRPFRKRPFSAECDFERKLFR